MACVSLSADSRVSNGGVLKRGIIVANRGGDLSLSWVQFLLVNTDALVPVGEILRQRQRTLLGHVMRSEASDPLFQVSFDR